jgi:DNA mismatch repair protein MutH
MELVNESWENSELYNLLETQKFFFIIFKINTKTATEFDKLTNEEKNKHLILDKVILWNTPATDIENKAKPTWEKTKIIINE